MAFCASLVRMSRKRTLNEATRRWSRGVRATFVATISTSSGLENHGVLSARLRSISETRSLDCAMPCMVMTWSACFRLVM